MAASPPGIRCDAHVHVFDPARFSYQAQRRFTPGTATAAQLAEHLRATGLGHVVLVQPSVYGSDHRALVDALAFLGARQGQARAVVVLDEEVSLKDLQVLDTLGARGARINLAVAHDSDVEAARRRIHRLDRLLPGHWHIQLHAHLAVLQALAPTLRLSPRTFVVDHFGLPDLAPGPDSAAWQTLLEAMVPGRLYVKASAPYMLAPAPYAALRPWFDSLLATRPDRLLWGSNWPHTQGTARAATPTGAVEPFRQVDDTAWRELCIAWAGEQAALCLGGNAARLYELG